VIKKYKLSKKDLQSIEKNFFITSEKNKEYSINHNKKSLYRLVFNISNSCNLDCKYCYANGGNYKSSEKLMNKEIAKKIIDEFFTFFDDIENIQFFGGEPLIK
jgi:uncharacterized protein